MGAGKRLQQGRSEATADSCLTRWLAPAVSVEPRDSRTVAPREHVKT